MKNIKENKAITLIALVTTIVILLILSSIGISSGKDMIDLSKFNQFKNELNFIQVKVNELNQIDETEYGTVLTNVQKEIFNNETINQIMFNGKTENEKNNIKQGFRYFNSNSLKSYLNIEGIKRDYIINVQYRYVICLNGFRYKGTTYYMADQFDDGMYNVHYVDKNSLSGDFNVSCTKESDRWKIEISNIQYNGYINDWNIKYRLQDQTYWNTANNLTFYVTTPGNYYVQLTHGEDINLGSKLVVASE